jgi:hypothetical protein
MGYTTVLKLLQIMTDKGLVSRDENARAHVYSARLPETQTQRQLVRDLVDRAFAGSATNLVMQALSTRPTSSAEIVKIRNSSTISRSRSDEAQRGLPRRRPLLRRARPRHRSGLCDSPRAPRRLGVGVSGGVDALTGTWTAVVSRENTVQVSLRPDHRGTEFQRSLICAFTDLKLSPEQVAGSSKDVSFELVRDAGVLRFAGRFQSSEGIGRFSFVASADFLASMRAFGYAAMDTEKVYALAVHDVSRWFIPELASLGYRGLGFDQLVALRVHGADAAFIRA